ncbi:MAG: methionyl-tRNA formyltransferase [Patescibacteria group bacterium]|nr:methionyl-tRNA formyltransferase [Patescibacteria group bacterium]
MNIAFFSSSPLSLPLLEKLNTDFSVKLVVTSPDKPVGRKQKLTLSPLKLWAEKNQVAYETPLTLKNYSSNEVRSSRPTASNNNIAQKFKDLEIDLAVVIDYGLLIPKIIYHAPKLQTINIHFSLLPKYRGPYPDKFTVLNGEKETGISYVLIDEGFDTGDILAQQTVQILPDQTGENLHQRLYQETAKNISYIINSWADWKLSKISKQIKENSKQLSIYLPPMKQQHNLATYTKRLGREDGYLSWQILTKILNNKSFSKNELPTLIKDYVQNLPAISNFKFQIFNYFKALSPWPGLWTEIEIPQKYSSNEVRSSRFARTIKRLKLIQCHLDNEKFVIDKVQLEGKNPVAWKQFCEAYKLD